MTKTENTWFQCAECPREGDTFYTILRRNKEIKLCRVCLERIAQDLADGKGLQEYQGIDINEVLGIESGDEIQFEMELT